MIPHGQIVPGCVFGDLLTRLGREVETIVEIGTWFGAGSTKCLALGLLRDEQRMWSFEVDKDRLDIARASMTDPRVTFIHGKVQDHVAVLPPRIGLLLLDGDDNESRDEFLLLWDRCSMIALDDTNPALATKNVANRADLLAAGWTVIYDEVSDRNGCCILCRGS